MLKSSSWGGGTKIFYKETTSDDQLGNKHTVITKEISETFVKSGSPTMQVCTYNPSHPPNQI
jgi:hypothetical protein